MGLIAGAQRPSEQAEAGVEVIGTRWWSGSALLVFVAGACFGGCKQPPLPGDYFKVELRGEENLCTGNGADYSQSFEYRAEVDANDLSLAIDDSVWATGTIDGCDLSYQSLAWSDYRKDSQGNELEIQWVIQGTAKVNLSGPGEGCVENGDWEGQEVFLITQSAHPDVPAGCTYTIDVAGSWEKEVQ